jgi:hypothetical protein
MKIHTKKYSTSPTRPESGRMLSKSNAIADTTNTIGPQMAR